MRLIGLLVLAAAPVAASLAADPPAAVAGGSTGQCGAVSVALVSPSRFARSAPWPAREIIKLRFEAPLRGDMGPADIEFRVYTPSGHLYRTLHTPVSVDVAADSTGPRRRLAQRASAMMPVAGTGIARRGIYGEWTVVPHLVGEPKPCGQPFTFNLTR